MKLRNRFLQDRIEAQERKIAALELTKKTGGEATKLIKKLEEIQDKEKECQKQKLKLEEDNMNLRYKLEQVHVNDPKIIQTIINLNRLINTLRESNNEAIALEVKHICDGLRPDDAAAAAAVQVKTSPKKTKELTDEVTKLKIMNEDLIAKLETKNVELEEI